MLENKPQGELYDARTGAHAYDAPEVTWAEDLSSDWINAAASRLSDANVADRVVAVWVVEQVEEVCAKLQAQPFADRPALQQREIHTALARSSQCVAANVAEVGSYISS